MMKEFKITLQAARVNAGLRVVDAYGATGLHPQKIIDYERGRKPIPEPDMIAFAYAYKIPRDRILDVQPRSDFE